VAPALRRKVRHNAHRHRASRTRVERRAPHRTSRECARRHWRCAAPLCVPARAARSASRRALRQRHHHHAQRICTSHTSAVSSAVARHVPPHARVHTVLTDRHDTALPTCVHQSAARLLARWLQRLVWPRSVCEHMLHSAAPTLQQLSPNKTQERGSMSAFGRAARRQRAQAAADSVRTRSQHTAGLERALQHSPTGLDSMPRTKRMYVLEIPRRADAGAAPTNALPRTHGRNQN
jgi:hypothetical protein